MQNSNGFISESIFYFGQSVFFISRQSGIEIIEMIFSNIASSC